MEERSGAVVVVIGGGISGLAAAWELAGAPPGVDVTVLEASGRFGGKLDSAPIDGRRVDVGPDAFLRRRPEALQLCDELGIGADLVSPVTRTASVLGRRRLRPMPEGLALGLPTRLTPLARSRILGPRGLAGCARDLIAPATRVAAPGADASVGSIVAARLGPQVVERLADPLVGGIHAGRVADMSAMAVFPALLAADGDGGSLMRALRLRWPARLSVGSDEGAEVFATPRAGMVSLVGALCERLPERGVRLRAGAAVNAVVRRGDRWEVALADGEALAADAVVVALPPAAAANVVRPAHDRLAALLAGIEATAVTIVTLSIPTPGLRARLTGSGFLSPAVYGRLLTACTYLCAKWPHLQRDDAVLLRASVGRAGDDRADRLDDDALVRRVVAELRAVLGRFDDPTTAVVTRWADGFPQYRVGHLARVAEMEETAASLPGLALAGAAYTGVGVPACIGSGRRAGAAALRSMAAHDAGGRRT